MKQISLFSVFYLAFIFSFAQSKETVAYRKESEEMRKAVWAWNNPKFKVRDIPQKYANASKIIIAHHTELAGETKSGFGYGENWLFFTPYKESFTEIVREVIKLNDKKAVTDYSELSFTMFEKNIGINSAERFKTFVGIRVIKPNGDVKEINADDVVLTKDEATEKKAKIAVPDLQPGDIIDFFVASVSKTENASSPHEYTILLVNDAPVLNYSFQGQIGGKYALEYRLYNNAADLKASKNEDGDILIELTNSDMPAYETNLWVAPARQFPFIKMRIFIGYKSKGDYSENKKSGAITKLINGGETIDRKAKQFSGDHYYIYTNGWYYKNLNNQAKQIADKMGKKYDDMSIDEKAALLYYIYRFKKQLSFDVDIDEILPKINLGSAKFNGQAYGLFETFMIADLNPAILIADDRTGYRINESMNTDELLSAVYLPGNKFFHMSSIYDIPFTLPAAMEGVDSTKSVTFRKFGKLTTTKQMFDLAVVGTGPVNLPVSTSDKNARIERLHISLNDDKSVLKIKRNTTLKGYYKLDLQKELLLYEDFYEYERTALKMEKTLIEELDSDKRTKKLMPEIKNALAEVRKKQKDAFVKDAKNWFEQAITDLTDPKIENPGVRHTAPDFVYSSTFNLNGLLKKAGNNIIVEIGKIQGTPLIIKKEERKRDIDVYMQYARSIEYIIELEIPDGYTAEGVKELNIKVENETGYFATEASTDGKTVSVKIRKHYFHNFETAKNFEKIAEFVNASSEWVNAKLLLKKK